MLWFTVQFAVLLLAAYFAGAMVGCMARRVFFPRSLRADAPARAAAGAPGSGSVAQPTRFERALTGATAPAAAPVQAAVARAAAPQAPAPAARAPQPNAGILPAAMGTSGPASVSAPSAPAPAAAPASGLQDLTRIRAIDEAMQKAINGLGIKTFADIAAWKPEDVARVAGALKIPGRIEQENWIEQAQILAKGGETYYSRRKLKGEMPSARATPDEGDRITVRVPAATRPAGAPAAPAPGVTGPAASALQAAQSIVTAAPAAAAAVAAAAAKVAATAAPAKVEAPIAAVPAGQAQAASAANAPVGMARDILQRIAGINAEVERLLNVQGVQRYAQIAGWSASDISRFDRLLGFDGRIARENWIEQAQILAKGGETAYARDYNRRTEAARPAAGQPAERKEDLSTLRSVRSEAYRGPDVGAASAGRPGDDLKRIRGVGVLIEKKLNGLGVTRYDQVANWTQSDIARFSEKLDFNGRIERENWVEQARILSAGGQTEFSQRVDRGEVETSRAKT